jgi:GNAT superfamily N-acetyltransferase
MSESHLAFVFECLRELRGSARYTLADFEAYVRANSLVGHPQFRVFVGNDGDQDVGILTCNRFAMPRYLGFGYEIEEVVVAPPLQRRGLGRDMVAALLERAKSEREIRKVIVKTDDTLGAGKLYGRYFGVVHTTVYGKALNLL